MLQSRRYQEVKFSSNRSSPQKQYEPSEWREVYSQAEKLYNSGDYELALMWYHRGHRLRPKVKEFQNGINKCEDAIANNTELQDGRSHTSYSPSEVNSVRTYGKSSPEKSQSRQSHGTYGTRSPDKSPSRHSHGTNKSQTGRRRISTDMATDVQHMMDLNKDRNYLKGLLRQIDGEHVGRNKKKKSQKSRTNTAKSNSTMATVVEKGVHYLDTRSIFWHQQMPLHIKDMMQPIRQTPKPGKHDKRVDENDIFSKAYASLLKEIMLCNEEFLEGEFESCVERTQNCIKVLKKKYKSSDLSNKYDILGRLYSVLGNAYFEMEMYKEALDSYTKDLEIANDKELLVGKSRALENMGRVYARVGEFDTAIHVWKEKLEIQGEENEEAWLYHEIGYCYLSKKEFQMAKQYAQVALSLAKRKGDVRWQLNCCLLIAQALAKLREYEKARHYFKKAYRIALDLDDQSLTDTIEGALDDVSRALRFSRLEREEDLRKEQIFEEDEIQAQNNDEENENQNEDLTTGTDQEQSPKPLRVNSRLGVDRSIISLRPHDPSEYSETSSMMGTDGTSTQKTRQKRVKIVEILASGDSTELLSSENSSLYRSSGQKGGANDGNSQGASLKSNSGEQVTAGQQGEKTFQTTAQGYIIPARKGKYAKLTLAEIRKEFAEQVKEKQEELKKDPNRKAEAPAIYFNKPKETTDFFKQRDEKKKEEQKKAESEPKETKPEPPKQPEPPKKPETKKESKAEPPAPPPLPQPVITAETKQELEKDKELREELQSYDEAVTAKGEPGKTWQSHSRIDLHKFPWKNTNKKAPKSITVLKRNKNKNIRRRAIQPSSDDEDSDEEYRDIVESKKRASPRGSKKAQDNTLSDMVNTPYGAMVADFKNQKTSSFVGHHYTSMNSLPIEQESPFTKGMDVQREDSFVKGGTSQRENSFIHREGSFVKAAPAKREASFMKAATMKRERSFNKGPTIQREGSFVQGPASIQRENSFVKNVKTDRSFTKSPDRSVTKSPDRSVTKSPTGRPPKSPSKESITRRKERTFYDQTESASTLRSLDGLGPNHNTITEHTYNLGIQSEYKQLNSKKLQSQKKAGLSQSLPALSYGRNSPHKRSNTTLNESDTKTKLPVLLPKSGKTNRTSESVHSTSDKTERMQKPHPKNEGGKSESKPKERGNPKDMEILKMILDMKQ